MSAPPNLEARVRTLEKQVSLIMDRIPSTQKPCWIDSVAGSFADRPEFDEVLRLGREFRREQNQLPDVEDGSEPQDAS